MLANGFEKNTIVKPLKILFFEKELLQLVFIIRCSFICLKNNTITEITNQSISYIKTKNPAKSRI